MGEQRGTKNKKGSSKRERGRKGMVGARSIRNLICHALPLFRSHNNSFQWRASRLGDPFRSEYVPCKQWPRPAPFSKRPRLPLFAVTSPPWLPRWRGGRGRSHPSLARSSISFLLLEGARMNSDKLNTRGTERLFLLLFRENLPRASQLGGAEDAASSGAPSAEL